MTKYSHPFIPKIKYAVTAANPILWPLAAPALMADQGFKIALTGKPVLNTIKGSGRGRHLRRPKIHAYPTYYRVKKYKRRKTKPRKK